MKRAIFGENSAKMYRYDVKKAAWRGDRFAEITVPSTNARAAIL